LPAYFAPNKSLGIIGAKYLAANLTYGFKHFVWRLGHYDIVFIDQANGCVVASQEKRRDAVWIDEYGGMLRF
jgi:hypothetical protein